MARTVTASGSDAKNSSGTFKAYPEGEYIGEVIDIKGTAFAKSGAHSDKTKYPANNIQFKFTEAGPGDEFVGKKFTAWQVPDFFKFASGKSAWLAYQLYKAVGVEFPEGEDVEVELPDLDDLYGEEIGIRLVREPQQDADGNDLLDDDGEVKYRNRVAAFFPASKGVKVTGGDTAGADGGFTL